MERLVVTLKEVLFLYNHLLRLLSRWIRIKLHFFFNFCFNCWNSIFCTLLDFSVIFGLSSLTSPLKNSSLLSVVWNNEFSCGRFYLKYLTWLSNSTAVFNDKSNKLSPFLHKKQSYLIRNFSIWFSVFVFICVLHNIII